MAFNCALRSFLNAVEEFFDAIAWHERVAPCLYPTEERSKPRTLRSPRKGCHFQVVFRCLLPCLGYKSIGAVA